MLLGQLSWLSGIPSPSLSTTPPAELEEELEGNSPPPDSLEELPLEGTEDELPAELEVVGSVEDDDPLVGVDEPLSDEEELEGNSPPPDSLEELSPEETEDELDGNSPLPPEILEELDDVLDGNSPPPPGTLDVEDKLLDCVEAGDDVAWLDAVDLDEFSKGVSAGKPLPPPPPHPLSATAATSKKRDEKCFMVATLPVKTWNNGWGIRVEFLCRAQQIRRVGFSRDRHQYCCQQRGWFLPIRIR